MSNTTRRNFLKGTAVAAAAAGLAGCSSETSDDSTASDDASDADDASADETDPLAAPAESSYPISPDGDDVEALWTSEDSGSGWTRITQDGAPTLGYTEDNGLDIIQVSGYAFKDLNRNGVLDIWEDWRQDAGVRAAALAEEISIEEAEGFILHYSLMSIETNGTDATDLAGDSFSEIITTQHARTAVSFSAGSDYMSNARWNNVAQTIAEADENGIPCNFSANPETLSGYPGDNLAIAASFDPDFAFEVSKFQGKQYRGVGLQTLLGPQTDVASEPRWSRIQGTYGEDPRLAADMLRACLDGLQSTYDDDDNDLGWGVDSVVGMMKHYSSDGAGEGGREAHSEYGKYNVFPKDNFAAGLVPFVDGGLNLNGATGQCASVMPNYSIAWSDDGSYGELVPSAYSTYKLNILRNDYGWDGMVCTDWGVTGGAAIPTDYNLEDKSKAEKFAMLLEAGTDQFGGEEEYSVFSEAFEVLSSDLGGDDAAEACIREAARRILTCSFLPGLFENPYVDTSNVLELLEGDEATELTREVHTRGIVMLKNAGGVICERSEKPTVYVPMVYTAGSSSYNAVYDVTTVTPASWDLPIDEGTASEYATIVTDTIDSADPDDPLESDVVRLSGDELAACDFALVFVDSPATGSGYETDDDGNVTYIPVSLQYSEYVADGDNVRQTSIAGDTLEDGTQENRSYYGQSTVATNLGDLELILETAQNVSESGVPVVVAITADRPMVFTEFEDQVDAILMGFGSDEEAFLQIAAGTVEPTGLLPLQMPASMDVVEGQAEDTPRDMECHVDTEGNEYDFAFGMNWSGVIDDDRVATYKVDVQLEPELPTV